MSDYEQEYYDAGMDPADVEALTAQARQETVEYIAPYLMEQQHKIDALYSNAAAQAAQSHREQQDRDAEIANEAQALVAQRWPEGWWEQNRGEIAKEISRRPGLLADAALDSGDPRQLADALHAAANTLHSEAKQQAQFERSKHLDREIDQMRNPGGFPKWGTIRESQSVDQIMRGR
jgi:hypothetical protein